MRHLLGICLTLSSVALAEPLECDFTDYRRLAGLSAEAIDGDVLFEWDGAAEGRLRATFGLDGGHPVIREMSVLSRAGHWAPLVQEARPVFHVAEGKRRISNQQLRPMATWEGKRLQMWWLRRNGRSFGMLLSTFLDWKA